MSISSLGNTKVFLLEDTLLLVLSFPAIMTLLHGFKDRAINVLRVAD
jgi:hypothetical protein